MKVDKKIFTIMTITMMLSMVLGSAIAFAQAYPASENVEFMAWLQSAVEFVKTSKGNSWPVVVSGSLFLLVGLTKVSFLAPYWEKLGWGKAFVAPALGLVGSVLAGFATGFSWQLLLVGLTTGIGAMAIADIFDAVKKIPGLGKVPMAVLSIIEKLLLKPKTEKPKA